MSLETATQEAIKTATDNSVSPPHPSATDSFIDLYGDLIYDLCHSLLRTPSLAQLAFQSLIKRLLSKRSGENYQRYEMSWILKQTCTHLIAFYQQQGYHHPTNESVLLEWSSQLNGRLELFETFFRKLGPFDQLLLLLKDKHQIPFPVIADALATSESSLKMRRLQALRTLEDWIWNTE